MNLLKIKPLIIASTVSLAVIAFFVAAPADAASSVESNHDGGHVAMNHDGGHLGSNHDGGHLSSNHDGGHVGSNHDGGH